MLLCLIAPWQDKPCILSSKQFIELHSFLCLLPVDLLDTAYEMVTNSKVSTVPAVQDVCKHDLETMNALKAKVC